MSTTYPRSFLFVPATRLDRVGKAFATHTDAVILDLEDAVDGDAKDSARNDLKAFLATYQGPPIYIRINGPDTQHFNQDVAFFSDHPRVRGIMLPKAESARQVAEVGARGTPVIPLIESSRGLQNLQSIAQAPAVEVLSYGGLDLSEDLGIQTPSEGADVILDQCRFQLLIHSRAANLPAPIETVFPGFDDDQATLAQARRARSMGFGGMLCIHPKQVAPILSGFAPDQEQIDWANRVLAAAEQNTGAFKLDGQMVDAPVIAMARSIIQQAS